MDAEHEKLERLHRQLRSNLGPGVCAALEDKSVTGIKVGERRSVWLKRHITEWEPTGEVLSVEQCSRALNTMASLLGMPLDQDHPKLSGRLPLTLDRIEASVWPSSMEPLFVIRLHTGGIFTLDDYVVDGIMQQWQADAIQAAVLGKKNIVWAGAVDSGKSTAVNACLQLLEGSPEHLLLIEDTQELQCKAKNLIRLIAGVSPYTMLDQIKSALRMDYDRLIIGETRGKEGYDLLNAWLRGKRGGLTTIHAESAAEVLEMFAMFCEQAGVAVSWRLIRRAIDVIVHMVKTPYGRRVIEIKEVQKDSEEDKIPIRLRALGPQQAVAFNH